jgi:hypothetical protein
MDIKTNYRLQKDWAGDPCSPKTYAWDGLTCSYAIPDHPRITGVQVFIYNMRFQHLTFIMNLGIYLI